MKYLLKTMEENPQEFNVDIFPNPRFALDFSNNIKKDVEVFFVEEGRKPMKVFDTAWYRKKLAEVGVSAGGANG